jgi:putative flavoprotein involved in K+ transport
MMQTTAVIIGAGHAGLAMSRRLTQRSIDHLVLERGEVANSWRTGRWPSLRLLTPNWQTRLPGYHYTGTDPDGYMPAAEVAATLAHYAGLVGAPVRTATTVHSVRATPQGFQIHANDEVLYAQAVVLATGACALSAIPGVADGVPQSITTLTPLTYRDPDQLPAGGGVLVVGASATGVQLAAEIHRSRRPVTLAAGEHVRLPRTYRGRDIFWWLEATGLLAERHDQIDDLTRARHLPSPQLTGGRATFTDLNSLAQQGIRVTGRLGRVIDGVAQFSGSLPNTCKLADLKMNRFLNRADEWATAAGLDDQLPPPCRFPPTRTDPRTPLELDLTTGEITTVLWATGFRPDHSWLHIPVFDHADRIQHHGGIVTTAPGLYLLGLPVLRTRASTYIHGAIADTHAVASHLHSFLGRGANDNQPARAGTGRRSSFLNDTGHLKACANGLRN